MAAQMRVHHTVTMLDGKVVEGESRMPPPLADRFAFERQFRKSYDSIFSHFRPVVDKDGAPVLGADGKPEMEMDPDNPVLMAEDMFFIYCALRREGKVAAKYEAWCEQLDDITSTRLEEHDELEDAEAAKPAGEEVGAPDPPARELSPLPG